MSSSPRCYFPSLLTPSWEHLQTHARFTGPDGISSDALTGMSPGLVVRLSPFPKVARSVCDPAALAVPRDGAVPLRGREAALFVSVTPSQFRVSPAVLSQTRGTAETTCPRSHLAAEMSPHCPHISGQLPTPVQRSSSTFWICPHRIPAARGQATHKHTLWKS